MAKNKKYGVLQGPVEDMKRVRNGVVGLAPLLDHAFKQDMAPLIPGNQSIYGVLGMKKGGVVKKGKPPKGFKPPKRRGR